MEEREEEKKLLVPRIRFGSFELLNIDAETLFSTFLCRETRDEFLRIFFFFFSPFPPLNRILHFTFRHDAFNQIIYHPFLYYSPSFPFLLKCKPIEM